MALKQSWQTQLRNSRKLPMAHTPPNYMAIKTMGYNCFEYLALQNLCSNGSLHKQFTLFGVWVAAAAEARHSNEISMQFW